MCRRNVIKTQPGTPAWRSRPSSCSQHTLGPLVSAVRGEGGTQDHLSLRGAKRSAGARPRGQVCRSKQLGLCTPAGSCARRPMNDSVSFTAGRIPRSHHRDIHGLPQLSRKPAKGILWAQIRRALWAPLYGQGVGWGGWGGTHRDVVELSESPRLLGLCES